MKSVKYSGNSSVTPPLYKLAVTIEDQEVPMEVDTGSYTGDIIQCLGEKEMDVKVGDQVGTLFIRLVQGPTLLGRDMMSKFTLPWQNTFSSISTALRIQFSSTLICLRLVQRENLKESKCHCELVMKALCLKKQE